jgi:hypothetical protein
MSSIADILRNYSSAPHVAADLAESLGHFDLATAIREWSRLRDSYETGARLPQEGARSLWSTSIIANARSVLADGRPCCATPPRPDIIPT